MKCGVASRLTGCERVRAPSSEETDEEGEEGAAEGGGAPLNFPVIFRKRSDWTDGRRTAFQHRDAAALRPNSEQTGAEETV